MLAREAVRLDQLVAGEDLRDRRLARVELVVVGAAELDDQRRRLGGSSRQYSGVPGMFHAAAISAGATISSVARAPAATSAGTAAAAASMFAKCTHASDRRASAPGACA